MKQKYSICLFTWFFWVILKGVGNQKGNRKFSINYYILKALFSVASKHASLNASEYVGCG